MLDSRPEKRFSEKEAALLFRQIVDGLSYMNHHNTIHKDLKPENVLVHFPHMEDDEDQEEYIRNWTHKVPILL